MPDREKVIDELKGMVMVCAIYGDDEAIETLNSAISLLKDQDNGIEPIKSTTEQKEFADRIGIAVPGFWCGACHFNLIGCPKFCPNCGKKVKWDD